MMMLLSVPALAGALSVGDRVTFGQYEQDNNTENGQEAIEWQVLAFDNSSVQLITVMGLDGIQYHWQYVPVTWAECSLRAWLNGDFLSNAFSDKEKEALLPQKLLNENNTAYKTNGGAETEDYVYILSANESKKLLTPAAKRQLKPTAYAIENNVYAKADGKNAGFCWWWVRNPGREQDTAMYIKDDGSVFFKGIDVDYFSAAVRPVVHVKTDYFEE